MPYAHAPKAQMSIISNDANDAPAAYAVLEKKIAQIPPQYQQELLDFIDFLISRPETPRNGLDEAIAELERGDYDTYDSFDDFLAEVEHES